VIDPLIAQPLERALDAQARASVRLDADWPAHARVRGFCSLRSGLNVGVSGPPFDTFNLGAHCGDEPQAVATNRAALGWAGALPSAPCWLRQVHGTRVWRFDAPAAVEIEADAAVTSTPGVVLAVLTADCLPVLFAASDGSEVAAAHAGWRGLAGGVLEQVLKHFQPLAPVQEAPAAINIEANEVLAWLGPCIGPTAFEVGPEVRAVFLSTDAGADRCFAAQPGGKFLADLPALARRRLAALGVTRVYGNDGSLPWCTVSQPARYHSYRRDERAQGGSGRMAACIWRV